MEYKMKKILIQVCIVIVCLMGMGILNVCAEEEVTLVETQAINLKEEVLTKASISRVKGDVTLTVDGNVRVHYTTITVGQKKELKIYVEGENIKSIIWSSEASNIISVVGDKNGAVIEGENIGVTDIKARITTDSGVYDKQLTISTKTALSLEGYANSAADMHSAANETSGISRKIGKNDALRIIGENTDYYWVAYDESSGFVLKNKVNIPATALALDQDYSIIKVNEQSTLVAQSIPGQYTGDIVWSSEDISRVAVNSSGDIIGKKEGATRIKAAAEAMNGTVESISTVSVWTEVEEVTAAIKKMANGYKGAISDADNSAVLDKDELVTVLGSCGDYYYIRRADNSTMFVQKSMIIIPVTSIVLNSDELTIGVGQSYKLTAEITPVSTTDKNIQWSSKNSSIVVIDSKGTISGVKSGNAVVEARSSDGKVVAECKVIVQNEPVYDFPLIESIEVLSASTDSNSVLIAFEIKAREDKDILYQIVFLDDKGKVAWKTDEEFGLTNTLTDYLVTDLGHSKNYSARVTISYIEKGEKKTKQSIKVNFKTKSPKVRAKVVKVEKTYTNLKIKMPKKALYDSYEIYYREKGKKKYEVVNKKDYKKNKNIIKLNKNLVSGKTYEFEVRVLKKGKVLCKDTVRVKRGYTTIKTNFDKRLKVIAISWERISSASGYEIYRSEKKGKLGKKIKVIKNKNVTNFNDATKKLEKGKKYYYQVRPYWSESGKQQKGSSKQSEILYQK